MDVRVGVAGATGALGGEVVKVLDKVPWRPKTVVPMASARTAVPAVLYGESRVTVEDLDYEVLGDLDALIVALPAELAREVVVRAARDGVPTVDCSGVTSDEGSAPLVVPWINPDALGEARQVAIPAAPALLLASALAPLVRAGIDGEVHATVFVPASWSGRDAIEELSRQVVSLFNSSPPPRKIFEHGLAFDLIPQLGHADAEGWTDAELRAVAQTRALTGLTGELTVTLVQVPIFSGISADVRVRGARRFVPDVIGRLLEDGGVHLPQAEGVRHLPRPRRTEGKSYAHAGRIRVSAEGQALHLWIGMDNLRAAATAAAGAAGALLRRPAG